MVICSLQNISTSIFALLDPSDHPAKEKQVSASISLGQKGLDI